MSKKNNLKNLFNQAASHGLISTHTSSILSGDLGGMVIAGAAGMDTDQIMTTDVLLVTVLLDASSSIGSLGLEQAVRDGYNQLLDTFATARERESILLALWTFQDSAEVVHSYVPVEEAASLDAKNYRPGGCTSLYDTWCDALAANVAYAQQLRDSGTPCKSIVVIITDGEDVGSRRTAGACADISRELLASEQFVLAFVGVGDAVDFRAVASNMGVPDENIEVQVGTTPHALRQVFDMVSRSAIRVSQSQVSPSRGGFFH